MIQKTAETVQVQSLKYCNILKPAVLTHAYNTRAWKVEVSLGLCSSSFPLTLHPPKLNTLNYLVEIYLWVCVCVCFFCSTGVRTQGLSHLCLFLNTKKTFFICVSKVSLEG